MQDMSLYLVYFLLLFEWMFRPYQLNDLQLYLLTRLKHLKGKMWLYIQVELRLVLDPLVVAVADPLVQYLTSDH